MNKIQRNENFDKRLRYILENSLVFHPFTWNQNRTILRAQKFAQEFFLGELAHCSNGEDEAHLPLVPNQGDHPHISHRFVIGLLQ